jgi:glyoxylase-like metal-dependent hydrolase (beta-lactamase superfamily II)
MGSMSAVNTLRGGMRFDDLELDIISDGTVHVDAGGPFGLVPRNLYRGYLSPDSNNRIPMVLNCMLVRSEGLTILIDTGLGTKLDEQGISYWNLVRENGDIISGLRRHGVEPGEVDIVINTHLHADHCSGNTMLVDDQLGPSFPNAEYWVQAIEWGEAYHTDARTRGTYFKDNFVPLQKDGRLRLLHGETRVTKHLRCVVAPGHTRGLQVVVLEAGVWSGLFVGDMASYGVHMTRLAWLTAYDVLPLENVSTKKKWQEWALERDAWLFFQHDPNRSVGRLNREGRRLELVNIDD